MERKSNYFSEALRKARGDRSQAEFARFLGIDHQATYQRYESGRVPRGDVLHQIATRIGVSPGELLGEAEQRNLFTSVKTLPDTKPDKFDWTILSMERLLDFQDYFTTESRRPEIDPEQRRRWLNNLSLVVYELHRRAASSALLSEDVERAKLGVAAALRLAQELEPRQKADAPTVGKHAPTAAAGKATKQ